MESSWAEIRTGRDHSPITGTDKPDLTWGKSDNISTIKIEKDCEEKKKRGKAETPSSYHIQLNFFIPKSSAPHRNSSRGWEMGAVVSQYSGNIPMFQHWVLHGDQCGYENIYIFWLWSCCDLLLQELILLFKSAGMVFFPPVWMTYVTT